jgi:hypothetical protein
MYIQTHCKISSNPESGALVNWGLPHLDIAARDTCMKRLLLVVNRCVEQFIACTLSMR